LADALVAVPLISTHSSAARPCTVTRKFRSPSGAACAFVQGPFEVLTLAKRTTPGAQ
jgi:hypothetical protein